MKGHPQRRAGRGHAEFLRLVWVGDQLETVIGDRRQFKFAHEQFPVFQYEAPEHFAVLLPIQPRLLRVALR